MDKGSELRQRFFQFPAEESFVDYKEGVALKAKDPFTIKLIRHIIGMCNAGGGFIVIGYKENENKTPVPGTMDNTICASYDSSRLADMVEKYTVGSDKIALTIHKETNSQNGVVYPIIEVHGFEKRPFFCKVTVADLLLEGALYIRISSARTVRVADPTTWDQIIDQCISKRNEELLARFGSLVAEMGIVDDSKREKEEMEMEKKKWVQADIEEVTKLLEQYKRSLEGLVFTHWPLNSKKKWSVDDLKTASDKAIRRNTGWPIGLLHQVTPVSDGIKNILSFLPNQLDYWHLSKYGQYFYFRNFDEDKDYSTGKNRKMWFDVKIWRIAEVVDHTFELYKALGVDPSDKIDFSISHLGIKDRILSRSQGAPLYRRESLVKNAAWSGRFSLDYLQTNKESLIREISDDLLQNFDFFKISDGVFHEILTQYDKSRH